MRFVETPIFTEAIENMLDHDGYRALQLFLILPSGAGSAATARAGACLVEGRVPRSGCRDGRAGAVDPPDDPSAGRSLPDQRLADLPHVGTLIHPVSQDEQRYE